jgi:serine/threonine protein kinase
MKSGTQRSALHCSGIHGRHDAEAPYFRQSRCGRRRVLELGIEIADALDAAHTLGIIHPDSKTSEPLRDEARTRAKILDFDLPSSPCDDGQWRQRCHRLQGRSYLPARVQPWARSSICHRNRCAERNWMPVPICSRLVWSSMRWQRALSRFVGTHRE